MSWDALHHLLDAGLVARRDLRAAGVCPRWIGRRLAAGDLVAVHPGVLAVPGLPMDLDTRFRAALLQAGTDAALSHISALQVYGLLGGRAHDEVHVAVPSAGGLRSWPGVRVHRRPKGPVGDVSGLPCVGVKEAVVASAALMPIEQVRFPAMQAAHEGLVTREELADLTDVPTRLLPVMRLIGQEVLAGAESGGEANYYRLLLDAGLPRPALQALVPTYAGVKRVDAYWEDLLLGCEIEGDLFHGSRQARRLDRDRRNAIQAERVKLIDFSVDQVMTTPTHVVHDTKANLIARAAELGLPVDWLR